MSNQSSGLIIDVTYDASVNNAPAGFTAAVATTVQYLESIFTNPITLNFDVGYGEIDGQRLSANDLGESLWAGETFTNYSTVKSVLQAENAPGASTLPSSSPLQGSLELSPADAQALGLSPNNGSLDGYVGFSSSVTWSYSTSTPSSNEYYLVGVVEHEITEDMGRVSLLNDQPSDYSLMDLYRYSSSGVRDLATGRSGSTAYFSIDNGTTNLGNWSNDPNLGDLGDWYPPGPAPNGNDAFNYESNPGVINAVSSSDIILMEALGWTTAAPIVTAVRANDTLGGSIAISSAQAATLGVLASDTDASNTLSVSAVDGQASSVGSAVVGVYGTLTLNADGSYSYSNTNTAAVSATASGVALDVFTYTVSNGDGGTATSTMTVVITSPGQIYVGGISGETLQGGTGNYVLDGGAGNQTLVAGNGNQVLIGGPGDTLIGGNGVDTFIPGAGNNTITGGTGVDTVTFSGDLSNYTVTLNSNGSSSVINATANDQITSVDYLQFADLTVATTATATFPFTGDLQSQIEALYVGYFGRAGDPGGDTYWLNALISGVNSIGAEAASFSVQDESQAQYPFLANLSTASQAQVTSFITSVYEDLFNRTPDTPGLDYWQTQLTANLGNPQAVGTFILDVVYGAQNTSAGLDQTTIANKVTVADFLSQQFALAGITFNATSSPANTLAHNAIAEVTSAPASVTAAEATIESFVQLMGVSSASLVSDGVHT